jgi:catalase (peroxidase I)
VSANISYLYDQFIYKRPTDGSYGPVLLRLAWHSSGTYDVTTGTGGSNYATMRFEPEVSLVTGLPRFG